MRAVAQWATPKRPGRLACDLPYAGGRPQIAGKRSGGWQTWLAWLGSARRIGPPWRPYRTKFSHRIPRLVVLRNHGPVARHVGRATFFLPTHDVSGGGDELLVKYGPFSSHKNRAANEKSTGCQEPLAGT